MTENKVLPRLQERAQQAGEGEQGKRVLTSARTCKWMPEVIADGRAVGWTKGVVLFVTARLADSWITALFLFQAIRSYCS